MLGTPKRKCDRLKSVALPLQDVEDFFVAFERRNEIGAGEFGARPREHLAGNVEATVASGGAGGFERRENLRRDDDAGNFVVEAQRLLVAVERPDADEHRYRRLAAELFDKGVPVLRIKNWLGHRKVRA